MYLSIVGIGLVIPALRARSVPPKNRFAVASNPGAAQSLLPAPLRAHGLRCAALCSALRVRARSCPVLRALNGRKPRQRSGASCGEC